MRFTMKAILAPGLPFVTAIETTVDSILTEIPLGETPCDLSLNPIY